jgi:1,4-dihydroxy-2-naphthoyl-CoA hydrolase
MNEFEATPKGTIMEALGIRLVEVTPDRVVATMPVHDATRQPYGILHGGASVVLAETVASVGTANLIDRETQAAVGLEINANHIRPKRDGIVTAVGVPLHRGRTTMVWDIRIQDEEGRLICVSRCTVAVISRRPQEIAQTAPGSEDSARRDCT